MATGPQPSAVPALFPAHAGVSLDATARWLAPTVLSGGLQHRTFRLSRRGAALIRSWVRGARPTGRAQRALARALTDAGLAHPRPGPGRGPNPAEVTVVIPVRDRPQELTRCLRALRGHPCIVVDDGSRDPAATRRAAAAAGAVVLEHPRCLGPAAARNTGLRRATTAFVAFLDSDCVPHGDWLARTLPHFADPRVGAVAPRVVPLESRGSHLAAYEAVRSPLDMGRREGLVRPGTSLSYVPSAALLVRRAAVRSGFNERLMVGEDVDLVWTMIEQGWRIRYEPAGRVAHDHRTRVVPWLRRRFAYGTSAAPLAQRHPANLCGLAMPAPTMALWLAVGAGAWPWAAAAALLGPARSAVRGILAYRRAGPRRPDDGVTLCLRASASATLGAAVHTGHAVSRPWLPAAVAAALCSRRARRLLATSLAVSAASAWWSGRHADRWRPAFFPLLLADHAAYSAGVWWSCVRHRTWRPLLPRFR